MYVCTLLQSTSKATQPQSRRWDFSSVLDSFLASEPPTQMVVQQLRSDDVVPHTRFQFDLVTHDLKNTWFNKELVLGGSSLTYRDQDSDVLTGLSIL